MNWKRMTKSSRILQEYCRIGNIQRVGEFGEDIVERMEDTQAKIYKSQLLTPNDEDNLRMQRSDVNLKTN